MPCPHANGGRSPPDDPREGRLSRRQMIRAAVAVGGASGLAACQDREPDRAASPTEQQYPTGPADLGTLPERQHAWTESLVRDRFGNTVLPQHQAILMVEYTGPTPPTTDDRETVERAFRTLERAFQRGTGGDESAVQHRGLLFVVGYAPSYFEQFDADLPSDLDLPTPSEVLTELDESDATADDADAVVHLASGVGSVLLAAEQALRGELEAVNGVDVEASLADHFDVVDRRTGFIGRGQPARKYDAEAIPDSAPLSMGFKSGFADNLPSEDQVTLQDGPFAGGTTMQVSRLEHDLEAWYERDREERTRLMFSPDHGVDDVGDVGEDLASNSRVTEEIAERAPEDARGEGLLGHGQKTARARDEQFRPRILRRDFNATEAPGLHFDSWQRGIEEFLQVRRAMNGEDVDAEVADAHDGILAFIEVTNRATFLMPPRSLRALPAPDPER